MNRLVAWLKSSDKRQPPFPWLHVTILLTSVVIISFWIIFIFLYKGSWTSREVTKLPIAKRQFEHIDGPRPIIVKITPLGHIFIGDQDLTVEKLVEVTENVRKEYGKDVPFVINAEANTLWNKIQPVAVVLKSIGFTKISFAARDDDYITLLVSIGINNSTTNTPIRIEISPSQIRIEGKICTREATQKALRQLSDMDRNVPISITVNSNSTLQELVTILSDSREFMLNNIHLENKDI